MRRTTLLLAAALALLGGCAKSSGGSAPPSANSTGRTTPAPTTPSPPTISNCAVVLKATFGGREVDLGDCAARVGLRPTPEIRLHPGERLTLEAPVGNARPPVPTSSDHAILRLVHHGSGDTEAVYAAGRVGTATLVIEHPGSAVCVRQPAKRCVVASVSVGM